MQLTTSRSVYATVGQCMQLTRAAQNACVAWVGRVDVFALQQAGPDALRCGWRCPFDALRCVWRCPVDLRTGCCDASVPETSTRDTRSIIQHHANILRGYGSSQGVKRASAIAADPGLNRRYFWLISGSSLSFLPPDQIACHTP